MMENLTSLEKQLVPSFNYIDDVLRYLIKIYNTYIEYETKNRKKIDSNEIYDYLKIIHSYKIKLSQIQAVLYVQYPQQQISVGKQESSYKKILSILEDFNSVIDNKLFALLKQINKYSQKRLDIQKTQFFLFIKSFLLSDLDCSFCDNYTYEYNNSFYDYLYFENLTIGGNRKVSHFYIVIELNSDIINIYLEPEFLLPPQLDKQFSLEFNQTTEIQEITSKILKVVNQIK